MYLDAGWYLMETHATSDRCFAQHDFCDHWGDQHRDLPFINEPFNDAETQAGWINLGFKHEKFTGDLYDMRFAEPGWIDPFRQQIKLAHFSWSVYRMTPGTVLPEHADTYSKFRQIYGIDDLARIVRYVVFLEDWQSGHYFEIDNFPIISWVKGQAVSWRGDTPHIAANIGKQNRYTLQLTGIL